MVLAICQAVAGKLSICRRRWTRAAAAVVVAAALLLLSSTPRPPIALALAVLSLTLCLRVGRWALRAAAAGVPSPATTIAAARAVVRCAPCRFVPAVQRCSNRWIPPRF